MDYTVKASKGVIEVTPTGTNRMALGVTLCHVHAENDEEARRAALAAPRVIEYAADFAVLHPGRTVKLAGG